MDKQVESGSKVKHKSNTLFNDRTRPYDIEHPIIKLQNTVGNQTVQRLMSQATNINQIRDVIRQGFTIGSDSLSSEENFNISLQSLSILSRRQQKPLEAKILPVGKEASVSKPPATLHQQLTPSKIEFAKVDGGEAIKAEPAMEKKAEPELTITQKEEKKKESLVPIAEGSLEEEGAKAEVGEQILKIPTTPEHDPAFQRAKKQVDIETKKQRIIGKPNQRGDAITQKVTEAMDASALPKKEQESQGSKEININEMNKVTKEEEKNTKKFDAKDFKDKFKEMVEKNRKVPKTATEVKAYSKDPPIDQRFSDNVSNDISNKQEETIKPLAEGAKREPTEFAKDVKIKEEKKVPEPLLQAAPKQIEPKLAIPKPKTDHEVTSVQNEGVRIDNAMNKNNLSDEQLAESREPSFIQTLKIKDETLQKISETPQEYREQESRILLEAEPVANESLSSQLNHMNSVQRKTGGAINKLQKDTEEEKTEKRQLEIKEKIDGTYRDTVTIVKKALENLTKRVKDDFATGLEKNKKLFNDNVRSDIDEYYGYLRIDDKLFGPDDVIVNEDGSTRPMTWEDRFAKVKKPTINPDVYKIFVKQKKKFLDEMDIVMDDIANTVQTGLTFAQFIINIGKISIDSFILTLSADEQTYALGLKKDVEARFDNLETSIVDTRNDLLQTLADEYRQNVDQLEVTFNEINDELKKSWIDRAIEFVETVGKTIFELAELVRSILTRMANIVGDIIKHPIRFFETLVSGLKQGIAKFIDNIGTYLEESFWTWVTGASPVKNIQLSSASGIVGLFDLVLQVLNLGPADLRGIVEKVLGKELMEKVDKGIEIGAKALEPITVLLYKGPVAFWHYIKDMLEDNIRSTFDRIKESVFNSFIEKGLKWIAGFFIPGGGFIKIVKSIVSAFQFVAENLDRIRNFFDSIFDSMEEALQGNPEGVANKIIVGLKTGVVLALDFLAKQLGLGNLIEGVQKIIRSIRKPIINAIELVVGKVAKLVKAIGRKLGFGRGDKDEKDRNERELVMGVPSEPRSDIADKSEMEDADSNSLQVKIQAAKRLKELAGEDGTVEEVRKSIKIIHHELDSKGLKKMDVIENSEGGYAVVVQASDPVTAAEITPPQKEDISLEKVEGLKEENRAVTMLTTLTFDADTLNEGTENILTKEGGQREFQKGQIKSDQTTKEGENMMRDVLVADIPLPSKMKKPEGVGISGKVILDPKNPQIVSVLTWNVGEPHPEDNISHAEARFLDWADSIREYAHAVTKIDIESSAGPCDICMRNFVKNMLKLFMKATINHSFEKPHDSAHAIAEKVAETIQIVNDPEFATTLAFKKEINELRAKIQYPKKRHPGETAKDVVDRLDEIIRKQKELANLFMRYKFFDVSKGQKPPKPKKKE